MYIIRQRCRSAMGSLVHKLISGMDIAAKLLRSRAFALTLLVFISVLFYGRYITELNVFVFHDNGVRIVHETYTTDVMEALEEAGIFISKTDYVTAPQYPIRGSVAQVVIERSHWVNVFYDGRTFAVPTLGSTVEKILADTGFEPQENDIIQPPLSTPTFADMEIRVLRSETRFETVTEPMEIFDEYRPNYSMNYQTEVVVEEGTPGSRALTYEVTVVDGQEIDRALVETVETAGTPRVIEQGMKRTVTMRDGTVLQYTRLLECTATAYTTENKTRKINALGNIARVGTIAVDRTIIPLKSWVYVCGPKGPSQWEYGKALCEDVGGFTGNHVDLFMDTYDECIQFGRRKCLVYVLAN